MPDEEYDAYQDVFHLGSEEFRWRSTAAHRREGEYRPSITTPEPPADHAPYLQGSLSETATLALLYTKFTSFAFPLRPLLSELEKRAMENPSELGSLLDECHSTWVTVRKSLIGGRVEREIKRMEPNVTEIVELVSSKDGG